jgi:restriction endonuclease S subunit
MEEHERFQALIAEQARLLNHIKALLQRIKELVAFLEKSYDQQPMCMSSSCCRNLDDTNSPRS